MTAVQKLVTADSFDSRGVLVKAGHIGTFDTETISGNEKHLKDVGDFVPARVEIAAIAPTGPNPTMPQQVPTDAVQSAGGQYVTPGKVLVGEVTNPKEDRIDAAGLREASTEADVTETLTDVMGGDSDPDRQLRDDQRAERTSVADGTVADLTADLGAKTDAQLNELLAAEKAGKNRTGVTSAVQAELDDRAAKSDNA